MHRVTDRKATPWQNVQLGARSGVQKCSATRSVGNGLLFFCENVVLQKSLEWFRVDDPSLTRSNEGLRKPSAFAVGCQATLTTKPEGFRRYLRGSGHYPYTGIRMRMLKHLPMAVTLTTGIVRGCHLEVHINARCSPKSNGMRKAFSNVKKSDCVTRISLTANLNNCLVGYFLHFKKTNKGTWIKLHINVFSSLCNSTIRIKVQMYKM